MTLSQQMQNPTTVENAIRQIQSQSDQEFEILQTRLNEELKQLEAEQEKQEMQLTSQKKKDQPKQKRSTIETKEPIKLAQDISHTVYHLTSSITNPELLTLMEDNSENGNKDTLNLKRSKSRRLKKSIPVEVRHVKEVKTVREKKVQNEESKLSITDPKFFKSSEAEDVKKRRQSFV